jgi:hypothetical protein
LKTLKLFIPPRLVKMTNLFGNNYSQTNSLLMSPKRILPDFITNCQIPKKKSRQWRLFINKRTTRIYISQIPLRVGDVVIGIISSLSRTKLYDRHIYMINKIGIRLAKKIHTNLHLK